MILFVPLIVVVVSVCDNPVQNELTKRDFK